MEIKINIDKENNENKINIENKINEENKIDIIQNQKNNEKNIVEEKKEEKIIKKNNIISKAFPIKKDLDLKLKKQYKSAQKFDDLEVITGTILPESNLVIIGNIEGQLNIYYYYSGEISKHFSLFHEIRNINSIDEKTIIYSSDYSIKEFDITLGKEVFSFYAHDTPIISLYYDEKYKNIISCTKNGIINVYDFKQKSFIPYISHFLFDVKNIISTDYNVENKFFYSLEEKGNINIINIFNEEEIYNMNLDINDNKPFTVNVNLNNINQFIIGFQKGFKIFDTRNFECIEDWTNDIDFKVEKCILDNNNILIQNEFGLILYDYKEKKKIGERLLKNKITSFSFIDKGNNETKIVYGDQKGNIFYSEN